MNAKRPYIKIYNELTVKINALRINLKDSSDDLRRIKSEAASHASQRDSLLLEISRLENQKNDRIRIETIHQNSLDTIRKQADAQSAVLEKLKKDYLQNISDHQVRVSGFQGEIDLYSKRILDLSVQIEEKMAMLHDKPDLERQLSKLLESIVSATSELDSVCKESDNERSRIKIERQSLDNDRVSLQNEKLANDKRSQENEINRGTLEVWIRRLQKYYGESGIQMNILPFFNLKNLDE